MNRFTLLLFATLSVISATSTGRAVTVDDVDPMIGTGKAGNCYPGAQAPRGMISWSPNTTFDDYESVASRPGYKYDRDTISGFAVTHISGVGCHVAQDLPIMPVRGQLDQSPVTHRDAYASHFSHTHETARPGYYAVHLDDAQTDVALTVTERAGLASFQFAPGAARSVLILPAQSINGVVEAEMNIDVANRRVSGVVESGGFCNRDPHLYTYRLYYAAEFDQPITGRGYWRGAARLDAATAWAEGPQIAGYVTFGGDPAQPVHMRIGLSYVSAAGAAANLAAEIPEWDFDAVRNHATAAWAKELSRLDVEATKGLRRQLATALYHNLLQPSLFDDVNGDYLGFDGHAHTVAPGRHKYAGFSNWDTYRTSVQLQALLYPQPTSDMAESLALDARQGAPTGIPIWGLYNHETYVMNGYSGLPWIANAYAFGARDYDQSAMKDTLVRAADTFYDQGESYRTRGYVARSDDKW
ncbi:MAG: glycoside hydrolase domain-containing protein, partial [Lacunisphaera sp.]